MTARKGQSAPDRKARFDTVLAVLSGNPTPLKVPGLVAVLREAGHEIDDETPKKWGERGIPEKWARLIALLPRAQAAGLTADWMRDGTLPGPIVKTRPAKRVAEGDIARRASPHGVPRKDVASSAPTESISADQIAEEIGAVLEPLVLQLAAKGESVVARWLLAVAGEANDQSVDNVRPLIDLAREFLWRAEGSRRPDA